MKVKIQTPFPAKESSSVSEWEHKSVSMPETADIGAHCIGGWELVSVVRSSRPDWVVAYFKRRKQ